MFESLFASPFGLFNEFDRLRRELDRSFGTPGAPASIRAVARGAYPAINIGTTPKSVEIYAFAPGLDRDKIEVSVDKGLLTITGERASELPKDVDGRNLYANERFTGRFRRVVSLTDDVDPTKVEARYVDGLLRISVAKREAAQPQRIQIQ